tara:strand:+ start:647 stop:1447 length:801 start_codon:yes stop_codon:yes gene_type:complete
MPQKIHFITYGDSPKYRISKKHIIGLAKQSGFFESCKSFSVNDLDYDFKKKYQEILNQSRGGGFYIWKPKIISSFLENIKNNDIVVYTDSGSSFNYLAEKRFFEYIEILNSSNYGNLRFENKKEYIEKYWSTKEIFSCFNLHPESVEGNSVQLMGGHLIFKKNTHTRDFLNEFFNVVDQDNKLITDFYLENQIENFKENRHDQSILSILSKVYGGEILENETFFDKDSEIQVNFPFLSVRHYGHGKKDKIKFFINYKNIKSQPVFF